MLSCSDTLPKSMDTERYFTATLPWMVRLWLFLLVALFNITRRSNGTINRFLVGFSLSMPTFKVGPKTSKGLQVSDVTIDAARDLWFRLFVPTDVPTHAKLPVLIFFHGGGFAYFSPGLRQFDSLCRRFALEIQVIVVSVNYRLAPEHKYPAQANDGFDTLIYLDTMQDLPESADLSRCFIVGDSAGGNIAHHVACKVARKEHQFHHFKVIGLIAMQPFFGGEERTESEIRLKHAPFVKVELTDWLWKAFLPEGQNRDHEAANVFGPNSTLNFPDLNEFPPTLVFVGGFDPLIDWQKRYYEGLKSSGKKVQLVEYLDTIHAFYVFPNLRQTSLLMTEVAEFVHGNSDIKN